MNRPKIRPHRVRIVNQLGQVQSLPDDPGQFRHISGDTGCKNVLLLGLGPDPAALARMINAGVPTEATSEALARELSQAPSGMFDVMYVEAPEFARQMPASWRKSIPGQWRQIAPEELRVPEYTQRKTIAYRPNLRLFPDFWSPLLAAANLGRFQPPQSAHRKTVWMPMSEHGLLSREFFRAFARVGLDVEPLVAELPPEQLLERLRGHRPDLFFCINFQGMDPWGQNAAALRHLNIPAAVWCVDNPFHLLPALKSSFWKNCCLFVTDDWFIGPLEEHGARAVHHLPLAADPDSFQARAGFNDASLERRVIFVGRSSFPDKNAFFAGCALPSDLMTRAVEMMDQGRRPDYSWWWDQYGRERLWPGRAVRRIGHAAEQCNRHWRAEHLAAAARNGRLTIFGDQDWLSLLPENVDLRPEVDYYGPLANIYRQAWCTLNLTSLLLPRGLTQRHFDVWVAGGFLLTDATPGLSLFNPELVKEVAVASPSRLARRLVELEKDGSLAPHLRTAWNDHIRGAHTYAHRVVRVLETVGY